MMELRLDQILQNPLQPRRRFDEHKLRELADSIKIHGVVQPVVVTREVEGYRLVVGERRFRASRLAGLERIPVLVREFAGQQLLEVALIENLQREDLNPIEEAQAFSYLIKEHRLTQDELARRLGCSRPAVTNTLRLLTLPTSVRSDLEAGVLSVGHARAILGLTGEMVQQRAWQEMVHKQLSVRQAEDYVRRAAEGENAESTPKLRAGQTLSPDWQQLQEQLSQHLSANVRICPQSKGKGKIELHYRDQSQLERLVEALVAMG